MKKPQADPGEVCPFHQKDVSKVCHKCPLYVQLRGTDPQGNEVDNWGCAFQWMPILMLENSAQQRQTGAAVESFRNEMVKTNDQMTRAMIAVAMRQDPKLIEGK